MARKRLVLSIAAVFVLLIAIAAILLQRQRVRRHRVFRPAAGEVQAVPPAGIPPIEQWTSTFQQLEGEELAALLSAIESRHPELYAKWSLAYLHARALIEIDEGDEAARKLGPFLEKGHPLRDRALYHRASIAEGAEASRFRSALIFEERDSPYRDEAIDEELEALASLGESQPLLTFAEKIAPAASTDRRREISARIVEATVEADAGAAFDRGLALLQGGTGDDAADRVTRALDQPEILGRLTAAQLELFGETFQKHRHYDRAIAYLQLAITRAASATPQPNPVATAASKTSAARKKSQTAVKATAPPPNPRRRLDELEFALGRSHFGAERYAQAQTVYLRGAAATPDTAQKCAFLWHAARAAQLQGDDQTAETLMTQAIAVKGKFPATTAALTQRLRTRLKQGRRAEAGADLALLQRMSPNERAVLDGALAYAVGMLAAGQSASAITALGSIPTRVLDDYDKAEIAYWRARALEQSDPPASFREYLEVLRSTAPSHFAYFARKRLDSPAMAPKLQRELTVRESQVASLMASNQFELAKRIQTDRILLSSRDREAQLAKLANIYRKLPAYSAVLDLAPEALPRFPDVDPADSASLLMAMGLQDEAVEAIQKRWALRPASAALTRAHALNLGAASRDSIYAVEVMMKALPTDYHPDLLPERVRRLLYPRYFYAFIAEDAKKYGADPTLVLSIMREESRFNPRAKSQAAARGLLQFIITTARDIGRDIGLVDVAPEDLYDPRVIIRLGAKYLSELSARFEGNRYRVAAAYNAGPHQTALWSRLQSAPGDDYFLTAVNFDETKHYVRKVTNSYERYRATYEGAGGVGGLRAEP